MSTAHGPEPKLPPDLLPGPFADGARPELLDVVARLAPPAAEDGPPVPAGRDLVVLLDGVGIELLHEHLALTPTLRRLIDQVAIIRTPAPSTTATAMTSLLTGRAPIEHGVIGLTAIDPERSTVVNQLTGDPTVVPEQWMPLPTLGERSVRRAVHVGPAKHRGSHLTRVAFRGWEFLSHPRDGRVDAVRTALRRAGSDGLVHLHVDDVDHAGHRHGVDSDAWREALAEADALLGALLRRLPAGTRVHVTADHGMLDTDPSRTVDLQCLPHLKRRIAVMAGEGRAVWIRAHGGDDEALALRADLRETLGERALVLHHDEVLSAGILGPAGQVPAPHVRGRMGDLLILMRGRWTVQDPRRPADAPPEVGVHGSLTARESLVPLLTVEA